MGADDSDFTCVLAHDTVLDVIGPRSCNDLFKGSGDSFPAMSR